MHEKKDHLRHTAFTITIKTYFKFIPRYYANPP
jgi:hypothetical protein